MNSPILNQFLDNIRFDNSSERAIYLQLADAILALIKSGNLRSGQKIPSSREIATILKVNRVTVSKAYDELQMQGWLERFVGRGTFISLHIPEHEPKTLGLTQTQTAQHIAGFSIQSQPYLYDIVSVPTTDLHLDDGYPDPKLAPIKELYRSYRSQLTRSGLYHKFGSYGQPGGPDYYKEALSNYLNNTRGLKTTAQNILSVRGASMGVNLVCNGLINPGDVVVAGFPGWHKAERNFVHAKADLIGIPVDENGLVVDELKKICLKKKVRMVYVTPHHHYPTTVSLRIDRRLELLKLANEYGFIILEDDYDYDFHYKHRPLLPLASADENGMVIYCGSFSKSFSPAFRMGYLVASENVIEHLTKVRTLLDGQGDHILDNAMAELLNDGTIQRYLRKTLTVYRERRDFFCDLLNRELNDIVNFEVPDGGMTVWTRFDPSIDLQTLSKRAYQKGLTISDGRLHKYPNYDTNAIRLGFASSAEEELMKGVDIIRKLTR